MAQHQLEPYMAQNPNEVAHIIKELSDSATKSKKQTSYRAKRKTFVISDGSGRTVDSWMLQDWDYKKANLPTYARGLFTHQNNGKSEIAVRGYDKFFNVGEVRKTEWQNVENNTRGPYELSVKENGCIIFIAGLDDETLLITSKHSTGARQDATANHAFAGEAWVDKQLQQVGKTRKDLAKKLRDMNATAVAELCDDEFEEHVLPYQKDQAGLYLHGINLNLPEFATYPSRLVERFADDWGFRKVTYLVKDTIDEVKPFLDKVAETGNYDGRDTEGFVIRCQARDSPGAAWHDWFFKYKFEEPYLMYRQWREATKAVIVGKLPKYKKHKEITEEYLQYAKRQLNKDPTLGKSYNQNHGIIAMREGFLKEKGLKGADIARAELADEGKEQAVNRNVVLLPVATLGCGKTTVALALKKLLNWGHEQNDNIQGKGRRPQRFALAVTTSMSSNPVVIADRNNHQRRERQQIIDDVSNAVPDSRFVALHWVHDRSNYVNIRRITQKRVLSRGDNHQTIHAGTKSEQEIIGIMDGFMHRFESVDTRNAPDSEFDLVIDLDVESSSLENLETLLQKLHEKYPKLFKMPTDSEMEDAINDAMSDYKPTIKHDLSGGGSTARNEKLGKKQDRKGRGGSSRGFDEDGIPNGATNENELHTPNRAQATKSKAPKQASVEYFCAMLPAAAVSNLLDRTFAGQPAAVVKFYRQLKADHRIQSSFHVTLIHRAMAKAHPQYCGKLTDLWQEATAQSSTDDGSSSSPLLGTVPVKLETVIWDERVMAIKACLCSDRSETTVETDSSVEFVSRNEIVHATIGTAADGIKPVESNALLARWAKEKTNGGVKDSAIQELHLSPPPPSAAAAAVQTEFVAEIRAVLSR